MLIISENILPFKDIKFKQSMSHESFMFIKYLHTENDFFFWFYRRKSGCSRAFLLLGDSAADVAVFDNY